MALNFSGLGFTFGVKDAGLEGFGDKLADGFASLSDRITQSIDLTKKFSPQFAQITEQLQQFSAELKSPFDAVADAIDAASSKVTSDLVEEFRKPLEEIVDGMRDVESAAVSMGEGVRTPFDLLSEGVKSTGEMFTQDFPAAMERASASFHKESTRITIDSERMTKVFDEIKDIGKNIAKMTGLSKLQTMIQGLSFGKLNQLTDGMKSLIGVNTNLTTSLEAEGVQLAKSARAMGAQLGYTGKELQQFTSQSAGMASSLNVDAATAGKALYAFRWAGKEFGALGITSAEQLAKLQESGVADVEQMSKSLRRLREQFQFSDEGMQQFVGGLHALGSEAGAVPQMLGKIPSIIETLGNVTDETGQLLRGAKLEEFAKGTVAASRGFYAIFQDAEMATDTATKLAGAIASNREQYHQMFTGAGEGFPQMAENLMRMGVNTDEVFSMMQEGPDGFMKGMAQIAMQVKESGGDVGMAMAHMRGWMGKAFDPEIAAAMEDFSNRLSTADDDTLKLMGSVKSATVDLGKIADEAHSSGRTLQESFDRMKEAGIMGFRSISRAAAVSFVKDTGESFKVFNDRLKGLVEKGGPLAAVIEKLSLMHQIGSLALLPETLRPIGVVFGTIFEQVVPLLGVLAPLIPAFGGIMAPAAALALPLTIVGLRMADLAMQGMSLGEIFDQLGKDVQNFSNMALDTLLEQVQKVYDWVQGVDFAQLFKGIFDSIASALSGDISLVDLIFGKKKEEDAFSASEKIDGIISMGKEILGKAVSGLSEAAKGVDWGSVVTGVLDALVTVLIDMPNKLFHYVLGLDWSGMLKGVIEGVSANLASGGTGDSKFLDVVFRALFGVADMATRVYQIVWRAIQVGFELLQKVDWSGVASNLWTWLQGVFQSAATSGGNLLSWLAEKLPDWLNSAVDTMGSVSGLAQSLGDMLMNGFEAAKPYVQEAISTLIQELPGWMQGVWDTAVKMFEEVDWSELAKSFLNMLGTLSSEYVAVAGSISDFLGAALTSALEQLPDLTKKFKDIVITWLRGLPQAVRDFIHGPEGDLGTILTDGTKDSVLKSHGVWREVFKSVITEFIPAFAEIVPSLVIAWAQISVELQAAMVEIGADLAKALWDKFLEEIKPVTDYLDTIWEDIADAAILAFKVAMGPVGAFFDMIDTWVDILFRHSIDTDVAKSLKRVEDLFKKLSRSVQDTVDLMKKKIEGAFDSVEKKWSESWDAIKLSADTFLSDLEKSFNDFKGKVEGIWTDVKKWMSEVADDLKSKLVEPWERLDSIWDNFKLKAKDALRSVGRWVDAVAQRVTRSFQIMTEVMLTSIRSFADWLRSAPGGIGKSLANLAEGSANRIGEAFKKLDEKLKSGIVTTTAVWEETTFKNSIHHSAEKSLAKMEESFKTHGAGSEAALDALASKGEDVMMDVPFSFGKTFEDADKRADALAKSMEDASMKKLTIARANMDARERALEASRRELQAATDGPWRELMGFVNNPAWYTDWKTTYLRSQEELKAEIRAVSAAVQNGPAQGNRPAQRRPTNTDALSRRGYNYGAFPNGAGFGGLSG